MKNSNNLMIKLKNILTMMLCQTLKKANNDEIRNHLETQKLDL